MNITVWNEFRHEKESELVQKHYPEGIHEVIAKFLDGNVTTATLDMPEHGLTDDVLNNTDVLIWWGHKAHEEVQDEIVEKVYKRVLEGMGFIALHSAHFSKVFKKLMGTGCDLKWREAGEKERIWIVNPAHPIAESLPEYFELEQEEMYGEHFDIPAPDELLFISWFQGGEVFRSGATFTRGNGKIFYFRPGHETYPTYHNEYVQQVIKNAVKWVKPTNAKYPTYGNYQALEEL
ncbi:ThuA domain-containing protein [Macrococcus caseolyticus]|uniref:ThuA domain-containing protein n=1 Tax=Macrococcoides caseolyticum TaxID=69966 RepID=UPI0024BCC6B6|nr:ThuA domain-containing protein [Macrococcus caseolyticus]MDJ1153226.1 ThuA domain-containing protein [Macrococcus caseolyticus]MDJ1154898.1 ThuA domain-containing protein [Macrococcus caseolyticus]